VMLGGMADYSSVGKVVLPKEVEEGGNCAYKACHGDLS